MKLFILLSFLLLQFNYAIGFMIDDRFCSKAVEQRAFIKEATECAFKDIDEAIQYVTVGLDERANALEIRQFMNYLIPSRDGYGERFGDAAIRALKLRFKGQKKVGNGEYAIPGLSKYQTFKRAETSRDKLEMKIYCNDNFFIENEGRVWETSESPYVEAEGMKNRFQTTCHQTAGVAYARIRRAVTKILRRKKYHDVVVLCPRVVQDWAKQLAAKELQSVDMCRSIDTLMENWDPVRGFFLGQMQPFHIDTWIYPPTVVLHELLHTLAAGNPTLNHTEFERGENGHTRAAYGWSQCREAVEHPERITNGQDPHRNPGL